MKALASFCWRTCVPGCRVIVVAGLLFGATATSLAQRASHWRSFRTVDGLAESICRAITFSPRGYVMVKHANADRFSIFDGYDIRTLPSPRPGIFRIHETRSGQMWAIHPEGLQELRGDQWFLHRVPQIAAEVQLDVSRVSTPIPILPYRQGRVLVLLNDRLLDFSIEPEASPTVIATADQLGIGRFIDMAPLPDGGLWISGAGGVAKATGSEGFPRPDVSWRVWLAPPDLRATNFRGPVPDGALGLTLIGDYGSTAERTPLHFDGTNWGVLGKFARPSRVAWRGSDGDFHAASLSSAFRVDPSHPNVLLEDDEIVPGNYYDLAYEPGGAIWLATQDGIHRQAALNWNPPPGLRQFTDPVRAIHEGTNGQLFFLCARHLVTFDGEEWRKFVWPEGLDSGVAPESVSLLLPNGSLLFESEDGGYRVVTGKGEVRTFNPTPNARVRLLGSYQSGALLSHSTNANGAAPELLVYTGEQLRPTDLARLPADFGPPNWAYAGPSGRLLLAGTNGLALLQGSQWLVAGAREFGGPTEFTCAVEGPDGRLLVGSQRNLWEFDGKNWTASQLSFDRVNALQVARDGSLWCASRNGLHRLARGTWLPAGIEEGLPADAVTRVFEDSKGRLWAGTTRGIALFRPDADLDPPRTTILTSAKREIPASEASITIQYRGRDKWKSTPASRLLYSYSLDGRDWTAYTTETSVSLSDLAPGTHRFQVKAADRSGNIEPKPALLEFSVALPWYQETRLMVFTGFGVLTALFFAWLALNRHRELARSHAEIEKIVQVRTEQLERAHDELLHSEKMRALGTLAAGIAHDFNNILSIIKGSTQIIENNLQNRDKVLTRTQRIRTVVQQGTEIVQAMLGFSRLPEQQIALCDVNQVASDTLRLLGDHFLQRMKLELDLAAGLPSVPASKNFLQQILLNFIFNAADATEGAGRIILHTGRVERTSSPLALAPERAPGYLFIAVQDFGSGIVQDVVSRIFEPFFTTKGFSARRGTGLGLTMVYELAAKMGCGLKVESVRGKGSTFTVFVPIRPWPVSEELAEKAFKPLTAQEHT